MQQRGGPEHERRLVRYRLLRLQRAIERALSEEARASVELPPAATLALETELIALRREARIEGKHEGYTAARAVGRELGPRPLPSGHHPTPQSFPPPAPDRSEAPTPVNPVDWVGPRRQP